MWHSQTPSMLGALVKKQVSQGKTLVLENLQVVAA